MVEKAAQAIDDSKPKPEPVSAITIGAGEAQVELSEDASLLVRRDA
jgi:hypothetical protein